MVNKIYIVGPVGGGKSTLARKLSKEFGLVYCELDSIIYEPDPTSLTRNRKRSEAERDSLLNRVLSNEKWVVEDAGRAIFEVVRQKADSIILLEPPLSVRKHRIILRWVKQMLRLEKCGYRPGLYMLKLMFKWTKNYELGLDGLKDRLIPYKHKIALLQTEKDIKRYISENFAV